MRGFNLYIKMYLWYIDVHSGRGANKNRKRTIELYCMFLEVYIASLFDDTIFTEDNKIASDNNGGFYSTRFNVYENNIANLIRSLLCNKVVGQRHGLVSGIENIIDVFDVYAFPWEGYENSITGLQEINDLMFDTLLI